MTATKSTSRIILQYFSIFSLLACVALSIYGFQKGLFTSQEALQEYIAGFGATGSFLFVLFQMVQVVIPILPGGLGCLGGVLLFGAWRGFVYNYIGICIGSLLAFGIAKYCGKPLLHQLFSEKLITKYENWTSVKNRFAKLFALAIFFPVAPDDFLCYLAGTTEMSWKTFTVIILLGKPAAIALYSLGLTIIFDHIISFFA